MFVTVGLVGNGFVHRGGDRVPDTISDAMRAARDLPLGAGQLPLGMWTADGRTLATRGFGDGAQPKPDRQWMVFERCSATCTRWIARTTSIEVQRAPLQFDDGRWTATFRRPTNGCATSRRGSQRQAFVFSVAADRLHARAIEVNNATFPNCRKSGLLLRRAVHASATIAWTATLVDVVCAEHPSCREGAPGAPSRPAFPKAAISRAVAACVRGGVSRAQCTCVTTGALRWVSPQQLLAASAAIARRHPVEPAVRAAIQRALRAC